MKLSALNLLIAAGGLAAINASPIPIRVVITDDIASPSHHNLLRFGHAVAPANHPTLAAVVPIHGHHRSGHGNVVSPIMEPGFVSVPHRGCLGMRLRHKAINVANAFRKAVGLPLISTYPALPPTPNDGRVHIMGFPSDSRGRPIHPTIGFGHHPNGFGVAEPPKRIGHHGHHHHHHHGHGFRKGGCTRHGRPSFLFRVHKALMQLGTWEGRAVAFVLGCGIGVLLRMFWVMAIVSYRIMRGTDDADRDHEAGEGYTLVFEHYEDAEEVSVAPPAYVTDEKVKVEEKPEEKPEEKEADQSKD